MTEDEHSALMGQLFQFPGPLSEEQEGACRRLATQLVGQMPLDHREQRAVLRFMSELVLWQGKRTEG